MRKVVRWLPLLLWMAIIFYMSGRTRDEVPSFGAWDLLVKKGAHFLAYGLCALLAWGAVQGWKRPLRHHSMRPLLFAAIITILYAASDEIHQTFVPTRHGQPLDVLIDTLGGLTMLLIIWWWSEKNKKGADGNAITPLE